MVETFEIQGERLRRLARSPATRWLAKREMTRLLNAMPAAPVVEATVAGLPVRLDLSKGWDRKIFLYGIGDARALKAMTRIMDALDCRTAWDIGANRGNHSAAMAGHCRRLYAFEPDPNNFPRLVELLASAAHAHPVELALSDVAGEAPFFFHRRGESASVEARDRAPDTKVRLATGDRFAREAGVTDLDFMKVDVEGHELNVLRGMQGVIADQRPVIVLEVLASSSRTASEIRARLPGYTLFGNYHGLRSRLWMDAMHFGPFRDGRTYTHALAVPDEKAARLAGIIPRR